MIQGLAPLRSFPLSLPSPSLSNFLVDLALISLFSALIALCAALRSFFESVPSLSVSKRLIMAASISFLLASIAAWRALTSSPSSFPFLSASNFLMIDPESGLVGVISFCLADTCEVNVREDAIATSATLCMVLFVMVMMINELIGY